MNCKLIVCLLFFNLIYLSLLHTGDCIRFLRQEHRRHETSLVVRAPVLPGLARQAPIISSMLTGPLALAAFLFALPLLPSLVMAPLALAGIPPALNVLSSFLNSFTNGKPLNSILSTLMDPLHSSLVSSDATSLDSPSGGTGKPPSGVTKLDALKSIAKMFRAAISRRQTSMQNIAQESGTLAPDKILDEMEELVPEILNGTSSSNATMPSGEMEKSMRAMDAVFTSLREVYSVIRNGLRRYEITDGNCQSRIVCEIHQKIISRNKMLKSFSLNAIDLLSLEKHVDSWQTLNERSKQTIKVYISAAQSGFADKDCSKEFQGCPTLNTKSRVLRNIFSRHLLGKL